ncbi:MAG: hypothetical protein AAGA83_14280 [Cyanobacteria bacterium P01_F01_bin.116]
MLLHIAIPVYRGWVGRKRWLVELKKFGLGGKGQRTRGNACLAQHLPH